MLIEILLLVKLILINCFLELILQQEDKLTSLLVQNLYKYLQKKGIPIIINSLLLKVDISILILNNLSQMQ